MISPAVITLSISDIDETRVTLLAAALAAGCELGTMREDYVEIRRGSQAKLRFFGGAFVPLKYFPVLGIVQFIPGAMRITVQSDLGFGSMLGMKKKYQMAVEQFANELAAMSHQISTPPSPLGQVSPFPQVSPPTAAPVPPFMPSMQPSVQPSPVDAMPPAATKLCPFCAEVIQEAAIKCKHCGEMLNT
jgi:hypothetical protein